MKSILSTLDALIEQIVSTIATRLYAFNGTTWDRVKSINTGQLRITVYDTGGNPVGIIQVPGGADAIENLSLYGLAISAFAYRYNGSSWDRERNNYEDTVLASAARTIAINSAVLVNYNARGVIVVIDVTAVTGTPSLTVTIKGRDTLSGKYVSILVSAALTAVGTTTLIVYPGIAAAANSKADQPLPRVWRVEVEVANADSVTYSISANYIN